MLSAFDLHCPTSLTELRRLLDEPGRSCLLGGGTDLIVNLRRGIGDPPARLVETNRVEELRRIEVEGDSVRVGSSVTVAELAAHPAVGRMFPVLAEAAGSIAGPSHRNMGTVGGNLCLDTRCVYYNQSEWWRGANDYCLKHRGSICHVAPKSKICYATFSGDLPPALMVLDANVVISGPGGLRRAPVDALYTGDGERYLTLGPGELVTAVEISENPDLRTGYDKVRVRQSIDYPLAGVAVALSAKRGLLVELRVAFTGTNPRPLRLEGVDELTDRPLDGPALERLDGLIRRQVMAMRTTFTSGHYRRRAAGVLARRLVQRLYDS